LVNGAPLAVIEAGQVEPPEQSRLEAFFAEQEAECRRLLELEMTRQKIQDISQLVHRNQGAYEAIEARIRELQRDGLTLLEATKKARLEAADGPEVATLSEVRRAYERNYLGDRIANLMRPGVEPAKGGGGARGRKGRQPKPKFYCDECHTEFCIHRPQDGSVGRKTIERAARSVEYGACMTPETRAIYRKYGVTPNEGLKRYAQILEESEGLTIS